MPQLKYLCTKRIGLGTPLYSLPFINIICIVITFKSCWFFNKPTFTCTIGAPPLFSPFFHIVVDWDDVWSFFPSCHPSVLKRIPRLEVTSSSSEDHRNIQWTQRHFEAGISFKRVAMCDLCGLSRVFIPVDANCHRDFTCSNDLPNK